jgi:ABC-type branched-subunit amino acid transport system ATPase component
MIKQFRAFRAEKIIGDETYELAIDEDATIIVGPNGTGKSTFLNVFYLFITRQWSRLLQYSFSKLTLQLSDQEISISRTDLFTADSTLFSKLSPRFRVMLSKLSETQLLSQFLSTANMSTQETLKLSSVLEVPFEEIQHLRAFFSRQTKDLFEEAFLEEKARRSKIAEGIVSAYLSAN